MHYSQFLLLSLFCFLNFVWCNQPTSEFVNVVPEGDVVFFENFDDDNWNERWVVSKKSEYEGEWRVEESQPPYTFNGDKGLVVGSVARKHAIASKFNKILDNTDKDELVVQYEVRLQKNLDCGGAYIKVLTATSSLNNLSDFGNDTPYTIMFGPDKCGEQDKVHFIIRHLNPLSKQYEEKHLIDQPKIKRDTLSHLYTLLIRKDNSFQIEIDQEVVRSGNLLEDFKPSFIPPKEIDDPEDKKPTDWVDDAKIPDPTAKKPDDWDEDAPALIVDPSDKKPDTWLDSEPAEIPDPEAKQPDDWDQELDGEWEAPKIFNPKCSEYGCGEWKARQIQNPNYKGKWSAPMIDNPAYKGEWKPKQIPNPFYFEDKHPHNLQPMGGIGIELWTMTDSIFFDNILVSQSKSQADKFAQQTWSKKHLLEERIKREEAAKNAQGIFDQVRAFFEPLFMELVEFTSNPNNTVIVIVIALVLTILPSLLCFFLCRSTESPNANISNDKNKIDAKPTGEGSTSKKKRKED